MMHTVQGNAEATETVELLDHYNDNIITQDRQRNWMSSEIRLWEAIACHLALLLDCTFTFAIRHWQIRFLLLR